MTPTKTAKVFMSGRSQAVRIPLEFRFKHDEVQIRRDERTGGLILLESPETQPLKARPNWTEIFAALDAAGFPDDFMEDRDQGAQTPRPEL